MKKVILIIAGVLLAGAGFFYWYAISSASVGTLNIYSGDVDVVRANQTQSGKNGFGIKPNDVLKVHDNGRVSIILKDGSVVRLEAGSEVAVEKLEYEGKKIKDASFQVKSGKMWSKVEPLEQAASWEVETPTVVAAVRGTQFNTRYTDASSGVSVYKGKVGVALISNRNNEKLLLQNNTFIVADAALLEDFGKQPIAAIFDDWVNFNLTEDAKLEGKQFSPPSEIATPTPDAITADIATTTPAVATTTPVAKKPVKTQPAPALTTPAPAPSPAPAAGPQVTSLVLTTTSNSVDAGLSILLKVKATYSDKTTADLGSKVSWQQTPEIGTIKSPGYFAGVIEGTTKITATLNNIFSNSITITVGSSPSPSPVPAQKTLTRIAVSYVKNQSSANLTYYAPPTVQFGATGYYSDGSAAGITNQVSWAVSGQAGGAINSGGLYTPKSQGPETVTASLDNITANTNITIP